MLLRNLATSIVLYEKVTTTLPKAKAVQPVLERKIAHALKGGLSQRRSLVSFFTDKNAVNKLFLEFLPSYKKKTSGFTRIIRLGQRKGDRATEASIQLLVPEELEALRKEKAKKKKEEDSSKKTKAKVKVETKVRQKK